MFSNFLGRQWLPEFSRRFRDAVVVTYAAESSWLTKGSGQALNYWSSPAPSEPPDGNKVPGATILEERWPQEDEDEATAQQDIPLPLPVHALWTPRSSRWDGRDLLAFFAGSLNSPVRHALFRLFGDAAASEAMSAGVGALPPQISDPSCQDSLSGNIVPSTAAGSTAAGSTGWYLYRGQWRSASRPRKHIELFGSATRLRISQASDMMYRSRFCFVPDGDQPNTQRLVESVAHGCLPVVISSRWVPPFRRLISWRDCAIFIREDEIDRLPDLLDELEGSPELLRQMHGRLEMLAQVLVHGGIKQQTWWYPVMLLAELRHRREEGFLLNRQQIGAAQQQQRRPRRRRNPAGPRGVRGREFIWWRGSQNSSSPGFWEEFLLPPEAPLPAPAAAAAE